jgi:peptide/nickel transport system substrate-binding protein
MRTRHRGHVILAGALLLVAACSSSSDNADKSAPASTAAGSASTAAGAQSTAAATTAPQTDPNGKLVFGLSVVPRNMDPVTANGIGDLPALAPVYDRLIDYASGEYKPMLATSWQFSPDGSVLELKLRTDVKFQDGSTFDAAAVKANIERGQTNPKSNVKGFLSPIQSVEVVDPATVRLHVKPGEGYGLLSALSLLPGMMVSPAAMDKPDLDQYGVGTGPYVIKPGTFSPNDRSTFVRAPGTYWGGPDRQRLAEFEEIRFTDPVTAENALKSGQVDVSMVPDATQMKRLESAGGFQMRLVETLNPMGIKFNLTRPGVSDVRVRQAIAYAVDRDTLVATVLQGHCTDKPIHQFIAEGRPGYVKSLDQLYPYDPKKAQDLLAQAGVKGLQINGMDVSLQEQLEIAVQAQLKAVGIEQQLDKLSSTDANPAWNAGKYDAWAWPIVTATDPSLVLHDAVVENFQLPATTDKVKSAATGLLDQSKTDAQREQVMAATNQAAVEDVVAIPLCFVQSRAAARKGVVGLDEQPFLSIQSLLDPTHFAVATP